MSCLCQQPNVTFLTRLVKEGNRYGLKCEYCGRISWGKMVSIPIDEEQAERLKPPANA